MEEKELMLKLGEKTAEMLEKASEGHKKDVEALCAELRKELGAESEGWKNLQKQLDEIQTEQKKSVKQKELEQMPIGHQIKAAFETPEFKASQKRKFDGSGVEFVIKADDITNSNSITNTIPQPFLVPGISKTPYRQPFLREITNTFNISRPTVYWYEETARTDGSAMRAEAGVYIQGDQAWTQYSASAKSMAEYQKFSDEMAEDNDFLQTQITGKLFTDLSLLIDSQQLTGIGTGNYIYGIDSYATTYSAPTGLATNVDSPSYFDILLAGYNQVTNALFMPSHFVLHPTNVAQLMTRKTSDAAYAYPDWANIVNGQLTLMGIPVIANTGVTVNEFYVGDFKKVNFGVRKDIAVKIWDQNSTDPIYGMKTITATARIVQFMSSQETTAIVKGDLNDTNITALIKA